MLLLTPRPTFFVHPSHREGNLIFQCNGYNSIVNKGIVLVQCEARKCFCECAYSVYAIEQKYFQKRSNVPTIWFYLTGFIVGNNNTSLIDAELVSSITSLSSPSPSPPVGGIPYSSEVTKSSSTSAVKCPCA